MTYYTSAVSVSGPVWVRLKNRTESPDFMEQESDAIYNRHRVCLFRAVLRRTGNTADAEDVVAIVFLEAWRLRERTRIVDGSLLPWLLTVTRNVTSNRIRSQHRYERMLAQLPSPQFQEDHAEY